MQKTHQKCVPDLPIMFAQNFDTLVKYNEEWEEVQKHFKKKGTLYDAIEGLKKAEVSVRKLITDFEKVQKRVDDSKPSPLNCLSVSECKELHDSLNSLKANVFDKLRKFFQSSFRSSDFSQMMALMKFITTNARQWEQFQTVKFDEAIGKLGRQDCIDSFEQSILPSKNDLDENNYKENWKRRNHLSKFEDKQDADDGKAKERQDKACDSAWNAHMYRAKRKLRMVADFLGVKLPKKEAMQQREDLLNALRGMRVSDFLEQYSYYFSHGGKTRSGNEKRVSKFRNDCSIVQTARNT